MHRRQFLGRTAALGSVAIALPLLQTGCASPQPQDYASERPRLELDQYFQGRIRAHGLFQKRGGAVVRRFTVQMDCHWQGANGVLDEHFQNSDGSTDRRVWRLTKHSEGRYSGTADDVVGTAQGQAAGNAFQWHYTLRLPVDGKVWEVQMNDWMYLIDDKVMLNRATMSKWGIDLGEVLLSFTKES